MAEKMTLETCPFCGTSDVDAYPADREHSRWNVCCGNPGCVTRGDNDYLTQSDAVAAWNRRHLAQPSQAVDVGAIREVIDGLHKEIGESDKNSRIRVATVRTYLKKLNRAIGNAQAEGSNGTG